MSGAPELAVPGRRPSRRRTLPVVMLVATSTLSACVRRSGPAPERWNDVVVEADALARRSMDREEQRGLVVAVSAGGQVWARGYGVTSRDGGPAPDVDTVFELASVTKTYTALLLAEMVARHEVRLDQPLAEVLPPGWSLHPSAQGVTLEHVITHRSGLPVEWPGFEPADPARPFDDFGEGALRDGLARAALTAQPGTSFAYNNFAVSVLGVALAHWLRMPFQQALEERVLRPLGLVRTWFSVPAHEQERFAEAVDAAGRPVAHWNVNAEAPAGGLHTSARDLLRYAQAHLEPERQAPASLQAALRDVLRPRAPSDVEGERVGLAWFVGDEGRTRFHSGRTAHDSQLIIDLERALVVVVLATSNSSRSGALARNLMAVLRGDAPGPEPERPLPEVRLDEKALAALVGSYQLEPGVVLRVRLVGGALELQATDQPAAPLRTVSASRAIVPHVLALDFELLDGRARAVTLEQGPLRLRAPRCGEVAELPACFERARGQPSR